MRFTLGHTEGDLRDALTALAALMPGLLIANFGIYYSPSTAWARCALGFVSLSTLIAGLLAIQTRVVLASESVTIRRHGALSRPFVIPRRQIIGAQRFTGKAGRSWILLRVGKGRAYLLGPFDVGASCWLRSKHSQLVSALRSQTAPRQTPRAHHLMALPGPPELSRSENCLTVTFQACDLFDQEYSFRPLIAKLEEGMARAAHVAISLPPETPGEDFVEGTAIWGDETLQMYFERSLGFLDLRTSSEKVADALMLVAQSNFTWPGKSSQ